MSRMAHKETAAAVYAAFHLSRDFFVFSLQPERNWGQIFYLELGGKKKQASCSFPVQPSILPATAMLLVLPSPPVDFPKGRWPVV